MLYPGSTVHDIMGASTTSNCVGCVPHVLLPIAPLTQKDRTQEVKNATFKNKGLAKQRPLAEIKRAKLFLKRRVLQVLDGLAPSAVTVKNITCFR